ncbi:MAG: response regulator transcription factor [Solirubrobacteraceae bacterium]
MVNAANHDKTELATSIEPRLRRALAETADAIHSRLEGPEPTDADAVDVTNGDAPQTAEPQRLTLRIATADDDPLARRVIAGMIDRADGLELVGTVAGVEEIVELAVTKRPDTVLLDWMMPDGGGPEAARKILERCPDTRVIALTASSSPERIPRHASGRGIGTAAKGMLNRGACANDPPHLRTPGLSR